MNCQLHKQMLEQREYIPIPRPAPFRGMKISIVFWTGGSGGHAMRNCVLSAIEVYGSGVWTAGIKDDFDYRNNVIMNSNLLDLPRWGFGLS